MPPNSTLSARQISVAIVAFLLPLALFFGWFFLLRNLITFGFMVAMLALLLVLSMAYRTRFKNSRLVGLATIWFATGCGAALFWALLINGFE